MSNKEVRKALKSITDPEALKKQGYVPADKWGKDHWSTLAYAGSCVTEREGFMSGPSLRCKDTRVGIQREYGQSWNPQHGTRLNGFFQNQNDKTLMLPDHDDIDCLEDMESEEMVLLGTTVSMFVQLTDKGREFEEALRRFKQDGGNFCDFSNSPDCKSLILKYESMKS